ncbi:MAG: hypothetical protein V1799_14075 [bacterium]
MGQFHSFTGLELVHQLYKEGSRLLLEEFAVAGRKKGDREFLIWEDSLARIIETEHVLLETIEYIHNNPVNKHWRLVDERSEYAYSSACFYDLGKNPIIDIDNYEELLGGTPSL